MNNQQRKSIHSRGAGLLSSLANVAGSVINKSIDLLPAELHFPGYQYCGPGTNLSKRLSRGDPGVNQLDAACRQHDIAYSKHSDNESRRVADRALADRAWERFKASDSNLGEKAAAWVVTNIMKAKTKLGGGRKPTKNRRRKSNKLKKKRNRACNNKKKGSGLRLKPYSGSGMKNKKKCRCHQK